MDQTPSMIFEDLKNKIDRSSIKDIKRAKLLKEVDYLTESYKNIEVTEDTKPIYESIVKKGMEVIKEKNLHDTKKIEYYLRYSNAALYDFHGNLKPLRKIVLSYVLTCILFLALSPQYFTFILPILFLLPIYFGLKGLKKRTLTGFLYSFSVMPMAVLTSIVIMRSTYLASKDFNSYIQTLAQQVNKSFQYARNLYLIISLMGVVLLISSIYTIVIGVKNRKMFV